MKGLETLCCAFFSRQVVRVAIRDEGQFFSALPSSLNKDNGFPVPSKIDEIVVSVAPFSFSSHLVFEDGGLSSLPFFLCGIMGQGHSVEAGAIPTLT